MLFTASAFAQNRVVSGKVTDKDGNPVPFASIKVKGSKTGAGVAADAYGAYTISVKDGATLVISATNFGEVEVPVGTQTYITTSLEKKGTMVEVVVTSAMGVKRAQRTTSTNAQVVSGENLNVIRSTNVNNALAGKVSGIQVRSQSAAALGRTGNVRLRGESEFGGGAGVLYVVDGTILPNSNDVNLDDIEDITVLQGPNAAALFGPEAANGAIVITTKRARKSAKGLGIDVNLGVQFDKVYVLPNYQNSYGGGGAGDFIQYKWQPGHPDGWKALDGKYYHDYSDDASWGPRMAGQEYIPWYAWYGGHERSFKTASFTPQPNNSRDFFNTGVQLNNNIAFSKATDNMSMRVSYGNIDVKGMLPTTTLKKNTLNANTSFDLSNRLTLGLNVNYFTTTTAGDFDDGYSNQSTGSFNQWFHRNLDMNIMRELKDLRTPTGILASWNHNNPTAFNPSDPINKNFYAGNYWYNFFSWFDLVRTTGRNDRLFGDASLTYKFSNDFKARFTYRKQQNTTFTETKYSSDLLESGTQTTGNCAECRGYYGTSNTFSNRQNFEFLASYNKKIKDFTITANAGMDILQILAKSNSANTNNGFNVPNYYAINNSKDPASIGNGRSEEKRRAVFATGTVQYKNYLSVDFTVRNDWFSGLPQANNDVLTKSVGAAFVFSDLIKDQAPWLTFGKLRASLGETPAGLAPYLYPGFAYGVGQFQWNGNFLMGTPDQVVDPNIVGSTKRQQEAGIELRFLKNRIGITSTYWKQQALKFPTAVPITGTSGFTSTLTNVGEITKRGVDVQLMVRPIYSNNFKWEINATWGRLISNKVVDLDGNGKDDSRQAVEGQWGTVGPYMVHAEGQEWGQIFGNGIKRINGQPVLNAQGFYVNDPNVYFGNVLPKYTGGVQNRFDVLKNFTFNVNIDYQLGGKFFSLSDMWGSFSGLTARTARLNDKGNPIRDKVADGGGIHVYGVDGTGKPVDYYVDAQEYYHNNYNNRTFDEYIYDLTFVKIREVSFGYNIPVGKLSLGKWLTRATFSVVANNPMLIYAKTRDFDPSQISNLSGEAGNFPGTRGVGVNLKLGF